MSRKWEQCLFRSIAMHNIFLITCTPSQDSIQIFLFEAYIAMRCHEKVMMKYRIVVNSHWHHIRLLTRTGQSIHCLALFLIIDSSCLYDIKDFG